MKYIKLKREDSICNICKRNKPLTWDHVPPKGGIDLSDMWVQGLTKSSVKEDNPPMIISQNGLKYRTLCRDCNSLLGKYDIAFKNLLIDIKQMVQSSLYLPWPVKIKTFPGRIAKSLLGHMLASKTNFCDSVDDNAIRQYILDDNESIPHNIRIFYWYYPYNCTIVTSDIFELDINSGAQVQYSIIKSFPLAFAITFDNSSLLNTNELPISDISMEGYLLLDGRKVHQWDFPEKLSDGKIHLVSENNAKIIALPKK